MKVLYLLSDLLPCAAVLEALLRALESAQGDPSVKGIVLAGVNGGAHNHLESQCGFQGLQPDF